MNPSSATACAPSTYLDENSRNVGRYEDGRNTGWTNEEQALSIQITSETSQEHVSRRNERTRLIEEAGETKRSISMRGVAHRQDVQQSECNVNTSAIGTMVKNNADRETSGICYSQRNGVTLLDTHFRNKNEGTNSIRQSARKA